MALITGQARASGLALPRDVFRIRPNLWQALRVAEPGQRLPVEPGVLVSRPGL